MGNSLTSSVELALKPELEKCDKILTDLKCMIVDNAPCAEEDKAGLKKLAQDDPRIIFTGYVFGKGYQELDSNACLFVERSGVGSTHPALVEAMVVGYCVILHNVPDNLEIIGMGDAGLYYDGVKGVENLREVLVKLMRHTRLVVKLRQKGQQYAQSYYSWDVFTDEDESLFYQAMRKSIPEHLTRSSK